MTKCVALLRGINVGGIKVGMSDLKDCFEGLGYTDVKTLLQTGNVVFESSENEQNMRARIETALTDRFHYQAKVLVYRLQHVQNMLETYPYDAADETYQHYMIFIDPKLADALAQEPHDGAIEERQAGEGVVYWKVPKGMTLKSIFAKALTKSAYKTSLTSRNVKTIRKITAT